MSEILQVVCLGENRGKTNLAEQSIFTVSA
jgi:hypothetical protein